jgi:hypothetical protein
MKSPTARPACSNRRHPLSSLSVLEKRPQTVRSFDDLDDSTAPWGDSVFEVEGRRCFFKIDSFNTSMKYRITYSMLLTRSLACGSRPSCSHQNT